MKRFLTAILILAAMYGYGMGFTGYNTYKLDTPPGTGVNPPAGYVFTWVTATAGVVTQHFRESSGDDHAFVLADYTNPANIVQTASYRFVTDTEKSTWNGKQDALGFTPVPDTRTVNSKQLNANVTLTQDDIGDGSTNKAFTATEQSKLSGIEAGANNYVHPTSDGSLHVPATSTTSDGKLLHAGPTAGSFSWVVGTPSMVQLGNVTNESKATMFSNPVFTGTVTAGVIKPAADSTTAVKVQNAAGNSDIITIDTTNKTVAIGGTPTTTDALSIIGSSKPTSSQRWENTAETSFISNLLKAGSNSAYLYVFGASYSTSGRLRSGSFLLEGIGAGGVSVSSAHTAGYISFLVNLDEKWRIATNGSLSNTGSAGTAYITLKAGTATASTGPLKFTAGTFNTTPEAGAIEFDGASFTFVNSDAVRRKIVATDTNTFGVATLAAGTVTVSTTKVTANSRIMLTVQSLGTVTAPKAVAITARTASTSFTITSADATDTSVVAWQIIEPL